MLEARAALTAASLATYNTVEAHPQLRTAGGEVGIPASRAKDYYETALAAAKEVIENGPYTYDACQRQYTAGLCRQLLQGRVPERRQYGSYLDTRLRVTGTNSRNYEKQSAQKH